MPPKIVLPDSAPGWSAKVPEHGPSTQLEMEVRMGGGRSLPDRVVFKYRESSLHMPSYMAIPLPFLKLTMAAILQAESGAVSGDPGPADVSPSPAPPSAN